MKHLTDIVSYDEAVKLKNFGCNIETSVMYKIEVDGKTINLTRMLTQRDWNSLSNRVVSAPTYAEVLDWLIDNGYDWTKTFNNILEQLFIKRIK